MCVCVAVPVTPAVGDRRGDYTCNPSSGGWDGSLHLSQKNISVGMVSLHTHVCVHVLTYVPGYRKEEKRGDGRGGEGRQR